MVDRYMGTHIYILDISIIVLFFRICLAPRIQRPSVVAMGYDSGVKYLLRKYVDPWEGNHLNVWNLPLPSWIGAGNKNTGKISLVIPAPLAFSRKMLVSFSFQPKYKVYRPTI